MMLSSVQHFAAARGYQIHLLWAASSGVSFCRFEELFAPVPGVKITNISQQQILEVMGHAAARKKIVSEGKSLRVFSPGEDPKGDFFLWDLSSANPLGQSISLKIPQIVARPAASIRAQAENYIRKHHVVSRLGIRVRVTESIVDRRKPHRLQDELDVTIKSLVNIPWYTRVFVATDSQYVQQMLASHFADIRFFTKNFDRLEPTGRYVHRQDKNAMITFLKEVECLCSCERIINIGGFLNDHAFRPKTMHLPYREAARMHLRRG